MDDTCIVFPFQLEWTGNSTLYVIGNEYYIVLHLKLFSLRWSLNKEQLNLQLIVMH